MLSFLILFPIAVGALLFFFPKRFVSRGALAFACLQFIASLGLFYLFDPGSHELQLTERFSLVPYMGVSWLLSIDGLSFWYVLLTGFLLPLVALFSIKEEGALYFFFLFLTVALSNGAFLSFDGILFYIFFELSLLPLFFMIFLWGGSRRLYAGFKFLIYTFFSSLFLLGGFVFLMLLTKQQTGQMSADITNFYLLDLAFLPGWALSPQAILFFCFAFAFAVKTPLLPFHTWLPLAHVEAPTGASVYLAAVLLKLGTYGWFRFVLPLFPSAVAYYAPLLLFMAVCGLLYTSVSAFAQKDIKAVVAYSSIAHIAYVPLGVFAFNSYGLQGAYYQTLAHGISSAGLFLACGLASKRAGGRDIAIYGGLAQKTPGFAVLFFLISLSAVALPLTGGFIAEFLVLLGSFMSGGLWVWPAILGVVLSAVYMFNLFQKMFLSKLSPALVNVKDLKLYEWLFLAPPAMMVFVMGVFPHFFFKYSKASLNYLNENRQAYSLSYKKELESAPLAKDSASLSEKDSASLEEEISPPASDSDEGKAESAPLAKDSAALSEKDSASLEEEISPSSSNSDKGKAESAPLAKDSASLSEKDSVSLEEETSPPASDSDEGKEEGL